MITFTSGNLFTSGADILVCPVNCAGVMGAGLALEFKRRWPDYFEAYRRACHRGDVKPGRVHLYCAQDASMRRGSRWIVSFPTKGHWREASRLEDIRDGLGYLRDRLREREHPWPNGRVTVAVPALGCGLGGLDWTDVQQVISDALSDLPGVDALVYEPYEQTVKS